MMPNITKGGNTWKLVDYLVGEGRQNEHTNPHVVSGSLYIRDRWGDQELRPSQVTDMAKSLDLLMNAHGVKPKGKLRRWDPGLEKFVPAGAGRNHTWHCSLSLRAGEGKLDDEVWDQIAKDFVAELGIATGDSEKDCEWVAIHHGESAAGNDHIHIVVNRVRGDGTIFDDFRDFQKAQTIVGRLEEKYGLEVLESRQNGRGAVHDSAADQNMADRAELPQTYRATLETAVRAASTVATSEADFVHQLRAAHLRMRPRFAKGRTDVVVGYSVSALSGDVPPGQAPWRAASKLAKDLTLPVLRTKWEDTPTSASDAATAWKKTWNEPKESTKQDFSPEQWTERIVALNDFNRALGGIDPTDRVALANASGTIAGVLSAAALRHQDSSLGPQLSQVARKIGQHSQLKSRSPIKHQAAGAVELVGKLLMTGARPKKAGVNEVVLLLAIIQLTTTLGKLHAQVGQTQTARAIERDAAEILLGTRTNVERALTKVPHLIDPVATKSTLETGRGDDVPTGQDTPGPVPDDGMNRIRSIASVMRPGRQPALPPNTLRPVDPHWTPPPGRKQTTRGPHL